MAIYTGWTPDGKQHDRIMRVDWVRDEHGIRLRVGIRTGSQHERDADWTEPGSMAVYFEQSDVPPILWDVLTSLAWPPPETTT
jgi:hypothetical protein